MAFLKMPCVNVAFLNTKFEHFAKRHSYILTSGNCYLQVIYIFGNFSEKPKISQKYWKIFLCGLGTVYQCKNQSSKILCDSHFKTGELDPEPERDRLRFAKFAFTYCTGKMFSLLRGAGLL